MPQEANGVTLLPIQLIEAGCNLLLCLLLVFLSTRRLKKGTLLAPRVK
jgi:prolipoprotein diacylglyceryltransferase